MKSSRIYLCVGALWVLLSVVSSKAAQLIPGNADINTGISFTFPVGPHAREVTTNQSVFYVAALSAGAEVNAISRYASGTNSFVGVTPEKVTLNGTEDSTSPLFNVGISAISPIPGLHLAATTLSAPQSLYVIDNALVGSSVLSVDALNDASGTATSSALVSILGVEGGLIAAAVKGNGQASFGTGNSGIAFCKIIETKKDEKDPNAVTRTLKQINVNGAVSAPTIAASTFGVSSDAVKIITDVASMGTIVDMIWSPLLARFYIAYDVQGAAGVNDGARSIAVAYSYNDVLTIVPLAPNGVFTAGAQNEIIGGIAASAQVTAHKVRYMRTSTSLDYLIVLGGNGDSASTLQTVYALPLTNYRSADGAIAQDKLAIQGTLADVTVAPVDDFSPVTMNNGIQLFTNRRFSTPATTPAGIYTSSSIQAQVGGGALPAGDIDDLIISGDTVFVLVGSPAMGQVGGIYYSQALFNAQGVIIGWTEWVRAASSFTSLFGMSYDPMLGTFIMMAGTSAVTMNTITQTQWGAGANPGLAELVKVYTTLFPAVYGGVQGINSYKPGYQGILDISVVGSVGFNQVVLAQTGTTIAGTFTPTGSGYEHNLESFINGTLTSTPLATTQVISISGGAIADCGPLQALEFGATGTYAWLFIGGTSGLAVLTDDAGAGWDPATGLSTGFAGLAAGMSFKKIGNYLFVRKLIADNNFLYVLTDTKLDRIDLQTSNFATNALVVVTLATIDNAPSLPLIGQKASFIDMVVSEKFALLTTSSGMIRVGSGSSIQAAASAADVGWTQVPIPLGINPGVQLIPISTTGIPQDISSGIGGLLYVLDGFVGTDRAQLNRFYIADTSTTAVTDTTIQPLPDLQAPNVLSFYGNYSSFRNTMNSDGSLFISGRDRVLLVAPMVLSRFLGNSVGIPVSISSFDQVTSLLRDSASGAWMVAGDFGLQVNE